MTEGTQLSVSCPAAQRLFTTAIDSLSAVATLRRTCPHSSFECASEWLCWNTAAVPFPVDITYPFPVSVCGRTWLKWRFGLHDSVSLGWTQLQVFTLPVLCGNGTSPQDVWRKLKVLFLVVVMIPHFVLLTHFVNLAVKTTALSLHSPELWFHIRTFGNCVGL